MKKILVANRGEIGYRAFVPTGQKKSINISASAFLGLGIPSTFN